MVEFVRYKSYEEISEVDAAYICTVAQVKDVTEVSLDHINDLFQMLHESSEVEDID